MRRNWLWCLGIVLILCISVQVLLAGETIYVKEDKAAVREGPDEVTYKKVESVRYGDALEVLETKDDWYKVKVVKSGKEGWIYKGKISVTKPKPKESTSQTVGRLLRGGSGSATTATAAASGLRDFNAQNYQGLTGDFPAVGYLEQIRARITDQEIGDFLKEGGLK